MMFRLQRALNGEAVTKLTETARGAWVVEVSGRVRVHLGTSTVVATVSLLDRDRIGPGEAVAAQLLLAEPVVAVCGQPFVIRQLSPVMTLGGGHVLQPVALRIRKENAKALQIVDDVGSTVRADRAAGAIDRCFDCQRRLRLAGAAIEASRVAVSAANS